MADINNNQELLQGIIDAPNLGLAVYKALRDEQGNIIDFVHEYINSKTKEMLGQDFTGRLLSDHGVDGIKQIALFRQVVEMQEHNNYVLESEIVDGWFSISNAPLASDRVIHIWDEITDLKKVEKEVKDQTNFIRHIAAMIPDIITITELPSRKILYSNNASLAQNGYDSQELLEMSLEERKLLIHEEDLPALNAYFESFTAQTKDQEVHTVEYRSRNKEGKWQVFFARGKVFERNADGSVRSILNIIQNITSQKKAEKEIFQLKDEIAQSATDKYYSLFNSIDEGFCVIELIYDEAGQAVDMLYLEANPAFKKQIGYAPEGKKLSEFLEDIEPYWLENYGRIIKKGKPERFESRLGKTDKWYSIYVSPIQSNNPSRAVVVVDDITIRKKAEEDLRASEERKTYLLKLDDAISHLSDPVIIQQLAAQILGKYLNASRAFYYETEPEGDSYVHIINSDYHLMPDVPSIVGRYSKKVFGEEISKDLAQGETLVLNNINAIGMLTAEEIELYRAAGVQSFIAIPFLKGGEYVAGINVQSFTPREWTLTEISITEETAERTWAAVERAKAEEALRAREQQLRRLLRQKDEFISAASHELKTPVTSIKAYAQIVQERLDELGNKLESDLLGRLNVQIDRLTILINHLLDTTQISEGQLKLKLEALNINELLKERTEEIKCTTNHIFEIETESLPLIVADRERIGQVITNFLSNAIKYSSDDTVITLGSKTVENGLEIFVQDQGYGIPEKDQKKVFDRFYRVKDNNMNTYPGMGLGLYISAQIIYRHGGTVNVKSELGKGSIFSFTLPC